VAIRAVRTRCSLFVPRNRVRDIGLFQRRDQSGAEVALAGVTAVNGLLRSSAARISEAHLAREPIRQ
jgi:hypothetical protein